MSTTKVNADGQERKTLSSQLDRLDQILDTLGEGLNEAVAQAVQQAVELAVREGVHQGVRSALAEVLSSPEVLAVLRAAAPAADAQPAPAVPPRPGRLWGWARAGLRKAHSTLGAALGRARRVASAAWSGVRLLRPVWGQLLVALGVGAAVGAGAYFAGPYVAAAAGRLAGVLSTLAVRAGYASRWLTARAAQAW